MRRDGVRRSGPLLLPLVCKKRSVAGVHVRHAVGLTRISGSSLILRGVKGCTVITEGKLWLFGQRDGALYGRCSRQRHVLSSQRRGGEEHVGLQKMTRFNYVRLHVRVRGHDVDSEIVAFGLWCPLQPAESLRGHAGRHYTWLLY